METGFDEDGHYRSPLLPPIQRLSPDELNQMIENHGIWLETDGAEGERADFFNTDLRKAGLAGANLERACFVQAVLRDANLSGSNLRSTDFDGANLGNATLTKANLEGANLSGANLTGANCESAVCKNAGLIGAKLCNANLLNADLSEACIIRTNFEGATLKGAIVIGIDLRSGHISQEAVQEALGDQTTQLPEGFSIRLKSNPKKCLTLINGKLVTHKPDATPG